MALSSQEIVLVSALTLPLSLNAYFNQLCIQYGQIHCELDLEDDIINKGKKQGDFSGNGSCLDWSDDLCGFSFARFPYTGLSKVPSPIIR